MSGALDYMKMYNDKTKQFCIFRAMGYMDSGADGLNYYKL